ncbi:MAG: hypothetical protein JWP43_270 [Ramlibacter sp.]|jgi:hypothetical protein|nr:hypothetical protein [Ramlibacter sp.]
MRWLRPRLRNSIRNSINAILTLGHSFSASASPPEHGIEDIRDSMLALVDDDTDKPHVKRRIRYAVDVQALWYLRGDVMSVLASKHGEAVARAKLSSINDMFENLLPQGLRSRPSPLNSISKDE